MQKLLTISALLFWFVQIGFAQNASQTIPKITPDLGEKIYFNTCANCHNVSPGKGGSIDGPSPGAVDNRLFVNSGYQFFGGIPENVLIAFELEE